MARARNAAGGGRIRIEAEMLDVRKDDEAPELVAYAFGAGGKLLNTASLKDGKGSVPVPDTKEPEAVRVVIGPPIDRDDDREILQTLMRIGAPETLVRLDEQKDAVVFPLDRVIWHCWLRFCTVRGTLLKRTLSGGIHIDLPVCGAEVEIYEVDPITIIWPKIPDLVIDRIRDIIRRPWPPPPPPEERFPGGVPFPPRPGPGPDPSPIFRGSGIGIGREAAARPAAQASFASSLQIRQEVMHLLDEVRGKEGAELELKAVTSSAAAFRKAEATEERLFAFDSGEPTTADAGEVMSSLRALSEVSEVRIAADAGLSPFKSALLNRPELLRPILCWLWPQAVTTQLVATVTTDDCGHFRAVFYQGCSSDVPDLYFKAYRRIGWWRVPILAPLPIACHTWWDYACGTEVTLWTTSPWAHTCPPCPPIIAPDHWVLPMAVGNTSLASIRGTSVALQPSTTASNFGLTGGGAPWGGSLRFRIEFDATLRTDLNVRFYRVRWRKVGSGNPFMPLTADIRRHYAHMVGPFNLVIEPFLLGPQTVSGTPDLYEIPPALPPIGQWVIADAVEDTTSGLFASQTFAPPAGAGLYEFELTLFTAAGVAVNATTAGIAFRVPTTTDLTATIPTANAGALGLVTAAGRFVMQLHVDNNECTALIDPPIVAGSVSADLCGLLRYGSNGDSVTLGYTASHPNGFATYSFGVQKGVTPIPAVAQGGPVGPGPGVHSIATTVGTLLGGCTIAGFAETLAVQALATDGWSRLSGYDDHKVRAFALAPTGA